MHLSVQTARPCYYTEQVLYLLYVLASCTLLRACLLEISGCPSKRISTGRDVIFSLEFYNFLVKWANDTACFVILLESLVVKDDGNDCVTYQYDCQCMHLHYKTWRDVLWLLNVTDCSRWYDMIWYDMIWYDMIWYIC